VQMSVADYMKVEQPEECDITVKPETGELGD
jgi:hypothetical protein